MNIINTTPSGTSTAAVANTPGTLDLVDTAAANGSFKTFGRALQQADMIDTLRGEGPFTVFAPTDAAFDKLPAGTLETLFKPENKQELVSLLNYHVIRGRKSTSELGKWLQAKTINGLGAPINVVDRRVNIDGAQVVRPDIPSANGVIHGIDKVNVPTRH